MRPKDNGPAFAMLAHEENEIGGRGKVIELIQGDCLDVMKTMADASVHCCVTSPPYWGLRDYGHDGQLGLEKTPDEYVAKMVDVFREVRRVLRDDGTLWLNLGDSYAANRTYQVPTPAQGKCGASSVPPGIKPKDLVGIPWKVAFALQADGWYLRQDIIWHKPNPMPESVRDRCTKAHEYIFLLSKSPRYYFDAKAIAEPSAQPGRIRADRFGGNKHNGQTTKHSDGSTFTGQAIQGCTLCGLPA